MRVKFGDVPRMRARAQEQQMAAAAPGDARQTPLGSVDLKRFVRFSTRTRVAIRVCDALTGFNARAFSSAQLSMTHGNVTR